jgi:YidC/Oxa1 family membrane protein insertase
MDKKSIFIGIACLIAGFVLMSYNGMRESKARQEALERQLQENEQALEETPEPWNDGTSPPSEWVSGDSPATIPQEQIDLPQVESTPAPETPVTQAPPPVPDEEMVTIENAFLRVVLSTYGGAIREITLKTYPEENPHTTESPNPVTLNQVSDRSALALSRTSGDRLIPLARFYTVVEQSARSVTLSAQLMEGVSIQRRYTLSATEDTGGPEPFLIEHRTTFINATSNPLTLDKVYMNVGTAAPTKADYMGFNLNASYYNNGSYDTIPASKFSGGGFIIKRQPRDKIEKRGLIQWGAVKNQFFTTIFTPEAPAEALLARGIRFPADPATGKIPMGVTAALEFALPTLQSGESKSIAGGFYTGPKDFDRLSQMELKQEDVMQLGWFLGFFLGLISFVAKMLLTLLSGLHSLFGNWGFAIILTTLVIRLCLWPLTAKAARASKRMQKLQKPLQEIREKYQDNPQKLNQEMMQLWKKHKINPLSGCWPVLLQFPIFIAFFNLLRNSSDLRFAEFLWINDLSMPDATIPLGTNLPLVGSAINVLPFIWLVSMYFQMKMMPTPSVDNAQTKIIKWMPFIFFPFTYYFSSGLVLYWTTTNGFSIFQQWITNRSRDEEDEAIEVEIAEMEEKKAGKVPSGPLISKKKKKKSKPNR